MMDVQEYRAWRPTEGIPDQLYLEAIHDHVEGLRFLLRGKAPTGLTLRLTFVSAVGYRNINESYRIRTWAAGGMKRLPTLMMVHNSRWASWLVHESGAAPERGEPAGEPRLC